LVITYCHSTGVRSANGDRCVVTIVVIGLVVIVLVAVRGWWTHTVIQRASAPRVAICVLLLFCFCCCRRCCFGGGPWLVNTYCHSTGARPANGDMCVLLLFLVLLLLLLFWWWSVIGCHIVSFKGCSSCEWRYACRYCCCYCSCCCCCCFGGGPWLVITYCHSRDARPANGDVRSMCVLFYVCVCVCVAPTDQ